MAVRQDNLLKWTAALDKLARYITEYETTSSALHPLCESMSSLHDSEATVEDALTQFNNKIGEMEMLETRLKQVRASLMTLRNQSCTLSPVSRLPPEVLSLIFSLGIAEEQAMAMKKEYMCDFLTRRHRLLAFMDIVACVSQKWRTIATTTASLWTHIEIDPPFHRSRLWLERSKDMKLDLTFDITGWDRHAIPRSFEVIGEHMSRCSSLAIKAPMVVTADLVLT